MPEASALSGLRVESITDFDAAAEVIMRSGAKALLIKGGHADGAAVDVLYTANGRQEFTAPRVDTKNTHGTGCTLSSAIAACLAKGADTPTAVAQAKEYISGAIANADKLNVGKGHGPTNHFFDYYNIKGII